MSSLYSPLWLVLVAAALVVVWWLRRRHERLRLLTTYTDALAAGEVLPLLPAPFGGALGDLQTRLSRAAAAEHARLDEARAAQHRLEEVLGGLIEGVLVIGSAGPVLLGNSRAEGLLDLPPADPPPGRPPVR